MLTQEALRHYKFSRNPFAVDEALKPEEMFFGEKHREILDRLLQAAQGRKFLILSGETGSGKTILQKKARNLLWRIPLEDKDRIFSLEELEELPRISADKRAYLIVEPENIMAQSAAANNFLNLLLLELGVGNLRQDGLEKAMILKKALLSKKQAVILWIDEGNQMNPGTLQSLKAFFELEDRETDKRLLTVIVAGQPVGLEDKIQFLPTLQEVGLRATQDCLKPLEKTDAENFIASRLALVGRKPEDIFTDEALSAILDMADRYGGRTPARINRIATAALLWKYTYNPNASIVGLHEVLA
jgi:type II secretory pathway predicted ATPase ExeA